MRTPQAAIRTPGLPFPRTALVCLENTHNLAGGAVWTENETRQAAEAAHRRSVPVHLDGARIFNAAVALGVPAERLAAPADSMMFCLSKGLSAPVGSVVLGSPAFIEEVRRRRQMVGGAMRQAGVVAAAGIVALKRMVDRLHEDHERARALADLLAVPGVRVWPPRTNMVMLDVGETGLSAEAFGRRLADGHNVWALPAAPVVLRFVTHRHVDDEDVRAAARAVEAVALEALQSRRAVG